MEKRITQINKAWQQSMSYRRRWIDQNGVRKVAALRIHADDDGSEKLIPVDRLRFDVLHDSWTSMTSRSSQIFGRWRVSVTSKGTIRWGGIGNLILSRLIDCKQKAKGELPLRRSLNKLEKRISNSVRYRGRPHKIPVFPRVWAGLQVEIAETVGFTGNAYETFRRRLGWPESTLRNHYYQERCGLRLLPAAWIPSYLPAVEQFFVDLESAPRWQTIVDTGLSGSSDHATWNFLHADPRNSVASSGLLAH